MLFLKLVIGVGVSAVFVYFTLKGVDLHGVSASLGNKEYLALLPAVATFLVCQMVKSIRWGAILSPIKKIRQRILFPLACVGFMAIIVAPMRLGELVRPYLVNLKADVPMGSGIATILVERLMDLAILLLFLFFVITRAPLPHWFVRGGVFLLMVVLVEFVVILLFMIWPQAVTRAIKPITARLPQSLGRRIEEFVLNLSAGFRVIGSIPRFLQVLALSFAVWGLSALAVYFLFVFCKFPFGPVEALAVTSITALGISLPAAPGLIGNFQFACMVALSFKEVPRTDAFVYAMVYYCLGVGINLVLGVISIPMVDIPLRRAFALRKPDRQLAGSEEGA